MRKLQQLSWLAGISFSLFLISLARPGISQEDGLNFISEIKGNLEIKREGRKDYEKAYVGDFVNPLDELRLRKGTSVKVVCNNLAVWNPKSQGKFLVSQGCSSTREPSMRPDSRIRSSGNR
ncbi:MAG: hypothetical protein JGK24_28595 [Microcoleus sp. PH2017_29_MFU_D_A]|jgi:hypothetical protein|uniref:hypothetical protein n=1 Tax=unclassified Microcoleus TaxID=2642155 RepID=UPI001DA5D683|nr:MULTISPECIES: hypothetical protein [unclassified Microcoleus]MCC3607075.1 hypothetical protein [Microcoleus sp. PH2017_29_MFU_D_A]MCC3638087.1 hypothetical protein [Microcoleus sp. PH2017_37_MFU_D_B]